MAKIVRAKYSAYTSFKIPKGINLEDKTQVKWWGTKHLTLFIHFVDKTREIMKIEAEYEPELDCKYADEERIAKACEYGYTDSEDDDEDEEEEEEAPTAKSIVASIIANVVPN
jgi:hypothetical protein